jgi:DNA-directed RNA polymerase specialized sigma24 family protein
VFWQIYDRWSERILAYFYRRTLDPEDSADLVAEAFAVAYQRRGHFRDIGKPGAAWLFGIARKELGRHRRRQAGELKAVRRLGVQVPTLDDESIDRIEALIDMEAYVAHGSSVAPMPFHAMSSYPYRPGEAYPSDEQHRRYLSEYNTRVAGQSPDSD